jgi:hypothetical protein
VSLTAAPATIGSMPVARAEASVWVPSTSTTPGCTTRPVPRYSLAPVFCNAAAVKLSSRPLTIRSLRATACR